MAAINIDELSEAKLIDLNYRIVARLRFFEPDARALANVGLYDRREGHVPPRWLSASGRNRGSI